MYIYIYTTYCIHHKSYIKSNLSLRLKKIMKNNHYKVPTKTNLVSIKLFILKLLFYFFYSKKGWYIYLYIYIQKNKIKTHYCKTNTFLIAPMFKI